VFSSNFYEPINFNGFVGVNKKWGYTRLYFLRSEQRFNIINGTRDARGRFTNNFVNKQGDEEFGPVTDDELKSRDMIPWNSQHLVNSKITSQTLFQFKNESALSINLSYAHNQRNEFGTVFNPFRTDLGLGLQTYYYDVRYALAPRNGWETTLGTNGMTQSLTNSGAQTLYPNYSLFDNGVFLFTKKSYERLKLSGGVRYDIRALEIAKLYVAPDGTFQSTEKPGYETRFTGFDKTYQNVSASVGGVYNLTERMAVRANASRGFRAPTVPELSSNGEHVGTFRYEIGNLKAIPEVAYQGDLGLTYESKNVYLELSLFQNNIQNYTYSERVQGPSGQDSVINNAPVFRYTQGNARLRGMEGSVTVNPAQARWISFTQSYSAVFGSNISSKDPEAKYLPFMPPPRWISQVKLTKDRWKNRYRNLYFNIDVEVNQRQDRFLAAYNTETATPAYTLVNMGLGGDVTGNNRKTLFSVYLAVTNLFDIGYQAHQSRLKYLEVNQATGRNGVFNMGRNLSFKVVIPFEAGI
jgi:iron complex outermembrane recepter protein